ncbi:MAG: nickel-dependent hydrogenase large subunit, partial [Promethearchaeia archaeon]
MKKIVDVCTRVEGHGSVNIFLEKEEISKVNFEIEAFRGFEKILEGKQLKDVPKIASRICGLCHASQSIASCKAIEDLFEERPSDQSITLRRLIMTGELLKSHSTFLFYQTFPDLLKIFNIRDTIPSPYELINFDTQLTTNFFELVKFGTEIDKILGGRSIHTINNIPGGLIKAPSQKELDLIGKYLHKGLLNMEQIINKFIRLFSEDKPPELFNIPDPSYIALNNYGKFDRYSGIIGLKKIGNETKNFMVENYMNYFDKDIGLPGINLQKIKNIVVGPIARKKIIEDYENEDLLEFLGHFTKEWENNILYANILRLLEMYLELEKGIKLLSDLQVSKDQCFTDLNTPKQQDGFGVVEAPRGILIHHYKLNDHYQLK